MVGVTALLPEVTLEGDATQSGVLGRLVPNLVMSLSHKASKPWSFFSLRKEKTHKGVFFLFILHVLDIFIIVYNVSFLESPLITVPPFLRLPSSFHLQF